jgi:hypothetical protein
LINFEIALELITDYPFWFIIFCFLLALVYAFFMYYRYKSSVLGVFFSRLLFILRFIVVFVISFLLISPLIKNKIKQTEKPVIIFAQDNSASIAYGFDSVFAEQYISGVEKLTDKLSDNYEVKRITFGEGYDDSIAFDFSENSTNFTELFDGIQSRFSNQNLGGLIVATDGLYNEGTNPYYLASRVSYPVYTIALGDTSTKIDAGIEKIYHNDVVFSGDDFIAEVNIKALKCKDCNLKLEIFKNDSLISVSDIRIERDKQILRKQLELPAIGSGKQRYVARLTGVDNDDNSYNNISDFYINIIDSRQNVLILYAVPHPDISAIYNALIPDKNFRIDMKAFNEVPDSLDIYSIVITHQMPHLDFDNSVRVMTELYNSDIPVFNIIGPATDLNAFNEMNTGLEIFGDNKTMETAFASLNNNFSLFIIPDELRLLLSKLPPLNVPIGSYHLAASSQLFFNRLIAISISLFPK